MKDLYLCSKCKKPLEANEAYEYRGSFSCEDHFDDVINSRDQERNQIIAEEESKLRPLKDLDISPDSVIGKANREIMAKSIEISSRESDKLKKYERGN